MMTFTTKDPNYVITFRNLSSFDAILEEINNLDLFNCPEQFGEMNDQLYTQYNLMVEMTKDPRVESAASFKVINNYGNTVFESDYSYGSHNNAKIQAFYEIAKYIKEHDIKPIKITDEMIEKEIRDHKRHYMKLSRYIKKRLTNKTNI